jgi:hypothetical protein
VIKLDEKSIRRLEKQFREPGNVEKRNSIGRPRRIEDVERVRQAFVRYPKKCSVIDAANKWPQNSSVVQKLNEVVNSLHRSLQHSCVQTYWNKILY